MSKKIDESTKELKTKLDTTAATVNKVEGVIEFGVGIVTVLAGIVGILTFFEIPIKR